MTIDIQETADLLVVGNKTNLDAKQFTTLFENNVRNLNSKKDAKCKYSQRIAIEPEVKDMLTFLQMSQNKEMVGVMQELLTQFIKEANPTEGDNIDGVKISFKVEKGQNSINITILTKDGYEEDVLNGSGGALTNIVSVGIRILSLVKSSNMQFIVLDEPDCWIDNKYINEFLNFINKLSHELDIQILLITHKDNGIFDCKVEMSTETDASGAPFSVINILGYDIEDFEEMWVGKNSGIKSIFIKNFQSHKTTMLPLSPHVTLIKGGHNIGKSTIVRAIRAVIYNEGVDSHIRHNKKKCQVDIELANGKTISWCRNLTSSPKEEYTLFNSQARKNGEEAELTRSTGATLPDWVQEVSGIKKIHGYDVQLVDQKKPMFGIDENNITKAKLLNINAIDGDFVDRLVKASKDDLADSRAMERVLNNEIVQLNTWLLERDEKYRIILECLKELENLDSYTKTFHLYESAISAQKKLDNLNTRIQELKEAKLKKIEPIDSGYLNDFALTINRMLPILSKIVQNRTASDGIASQNMVHIKMVDTATVTSILSKETKMLDTLHLIESVLCKITAINKNKTRKVNKINTTGAENDINKMKNSIDVLNKILEIGAAIDKNQKTQKNVKKTIDNQKKELLICGEKMGKMNLKICPTCNSVICNSIKH